MDEPSLHEVWIVESDRGWRDRLGGCIDAQRDLSCGEALSHSTDLLAALDSRPAPDLLVLEPGPSPASAAPGLRALRGRCPGTEVLVVSQTADPGVVMAALEAGARGYLVKPVSEADVVEALRDLLRGAAPLDPFVARELIDTLADQSAPPQVARYGLSRRESEVLALLVEGLALVEIAGRLGLSRHTVSNHLRRVYAKLGVHSRASAAARARRERLV